VSPTFAGSDVKQLPTFLAGVLIACALVPCTAQARWDSKEDDKSESTLEAMTDKELFNEAFDVCVRRAMVERQGSDEPGLVTGVTEDASSYLGVISQVASKSNAGVAPSWMLELTDAHTVKKCQGAFRSFLVAQQPREAPVAKKAAPRVANKAATPRHGDPLEQLPPWFAPPQQ
jgi:hypothetical protein